MPLDYILLIGRGIWMLKKLISGYAGFTIGVIFGAIVATLTSYNIFKIAVGEIDSATIFGIQDCLIEKLDE
tara:strand:- start:130 stop:342 length:213 start_codon:yes stop_codon:yes gene_type:complete